MEDGYIGSVTEDFADPLESSDEEFLYAVANGLEKDWERYQNNNPASEDLSQTAHKIITRLRQIADTRKAVQFIFDDHV